MIIVKISKNLKYVSRKEFVTLNTTVPNVQKLVANVTMTKMSALEDWRTATSNHYVTTCVLIGEMRPFATS